MTAMLEPAPAASRLLASYRTVRGHSEALAAPLSAEDCAPAVDAGCLPVKWHLAHTSWFFESMILAGRAGYRPFDATTPICSIPITRRWGRAIPVRAGACCRGHPWTK